MEEDGGESGGWCVSVCLCVCVWGRVGGRGEEGLGEAREGKRRMEGRQAGVGVGGWFQGCSPIMSSVFLCERFV